MIYQIPFKNPDRIVHLRLSKVNLIEEVPIKGDREKTLNIRVGEHNYSVGNVRKADADALLEAWRKLDEQEEEKKNA